MKRSLLLTKRELLSMRMDSMLFTRAAHLIVEMGT